MVRPGCRRGLQYCVCVASSVTAGEDLLAVAVTSTNDGADLLDLAPSGVQRRWTSATRHSCTRHARLVGDILESVLDNAPSRELAISRQYHLVQYFYGAASRRGAPPMPLQGVWTADNGGLPPWKGDYHNDLNTQMTYIAYQTAGHCDEGCVSRLLVGSPRCLSGFAAISMGRPGSPAPVSCRWPASRWVAGANTACRQPWRLERHLFYLHWRYTEDGEFLRERAYPWCAMWHLPAQPAPARPRACCGCRFPRRRRSSTTVRGVARAELQLRPDVSQNALSFFTGNG